LICRLSSNFRDFTWTKFSGHNLLSLVLKDQKLFLSLARRVPLIGESIPNKFSVCSSKGQALQLTHALDFLSIQPLRGVDGVSIEGENEDSIAILAMSTEIISRLSRLIYGGASPDLRLRSSA